MDSGRSSSAVRQTGLVQLGERPSWIRGWSSPARRMAELNPYWVQLGRSPNSTGPSWRTAELNPCSMIKFVCFHELIFKLSNVFPVLFRLHFFMDEKTFSDVFSDVYFVVTDFDPNNSIDWHRPDTIDRNRTRIKAEKVWSVSKYFWCRHHHAIRQFWGKEDEELEKEKKDQGWSLVIIDSSLLRWYQKVQNAQHMLLTTIHKKNDKASESRHWDLV